MIGQGRVVGALLCAGGLVALLGFGSWLMAARGEGSLGAGGFALGLFFALLVVVPLLGGGIYLVLRGRGEATAFAEAAKTKRLLNMVLTQGKVRISDAVVDLGLPREEIRTLVYDAVGKGLFSGYINWNEGVLYASEAAQGQQTCPNCGGTIEIAGKGVFQCPYCGAEIFLARGEAGQHAIQGIAPPVPSDAMPPANASNADGFPTVSMASAEDPSAPA